MKDALVTCIKTHLNLFWLLDHRVLKVFNSFLHCLIDVWRVNILLRIVFTCFRVDSLSWSELVETSGCQCTQVCGLSSPLLCSTVSPVSTLHSITYDQQEQSCVDQDMSFKLLSKNMYNLTLKKLIKLQSQNFCVLIYGPVIT